MDFTIYANNNNCNVICIYGRAEPAPKTLMGRTMTYLLTYSVTCKHFDSFYIWALRLMPILAKIFIQTYGDKILNIRHLIAAFIIGSKLCKKIN